MSDSWNGLEFSVGDWTCAEKFPGVYAVYVADFVDGINRVVAGGIRNADDAKLISAAPAMYNILRLWCRFCECGAGAIMRRNEPSPEEKLSFSCPCSTLTQQEGVLGID